MLSRSALLSLGMSLSASMSLAAKGSNEVEMVTASWYAGWHVESLGVDAIPWDKYTHVMYSFAVPGEDPSNVTLGTDTDTTYLPLFVEAAHAHGVKALLSVGGWDGSQFYSTSVGSEENRTAFIGALQNLTSQYDLDGLDFDWEYPFNTGVGCNTVSPNDTSNFLSFLQSLRQTDWAASPFLITADTSLTPWVDPSGDPSTDVSAFASTLDWINLMNYDVWGNWSTGVGPNSPLDDTCASEDNQQGSAVSGVTSWTEAGMPKHQIVLGVAGYGLSLEVKVADAFNGSELAAYPPFDASVFPKGDAWDDSEGTPDTCGVIQTNGGSQDFWNLVLQGWLTSAGEPAPSTPYRWDNCSQTDYIFIYDNSTTTSNSTEGVMISYDSPRAFKAKGKFVAEKNLRGFSMWETASDVNDLLLNAILEGAGVDAGSDAGSSGGCKAPDASVGVSIGAEATAAV